MRPVMDEPRVQIGYVTATNPSRREIRVDAQKAYRAEVGASGWIHLTLHDGEEMTCKVAGLRQGSETLIVTLVAGVTRDNVGRMKGASVEVPESEHVRGEALEVDISELVGLRVVADGEVLLGTITAAFETKANGVIEIDKPGGGSLLLPLIEQVVNGVDWESGTLCVREVLMHGVDDDPDASRLA